MGRVLLLMRHGKSKWTETGVADHDRALAKRGKRDAITMGKELKGRGLLPDLILTSTAKRARSTVRRLVRASGYEGPVREERKLYFEGIGPYLETLAALPDGVHTVLIMGHNPLVEELLYLLTGREERMPTAALAVIDLGIDNWADLRDHSKGKLRLLVTPKELASVAE